MLVLRPLFPKSSPAIPVLCRHSSKSASWVGALCRSPRRTQTWLSSHRSHSSPPVQPNKQSYDCEMPQGRAARFAIRSNSSHKDARGIYSQKTLFSLKSLYFLTWSKWNPETRCMCMAALPATLTTTQGNFFSHTDEEQLIPAGKQG